MFWKSQMVWLEGDIKKLQFESSGERSLFVWSFSEILIFTLMQFTPPAFIFCSSNFILFKVEVAGFGAPGDPRAAAFSQMGALRVCLLPELLGLCCAGMVPGTACTPGLGAGRAGLGQHRGSSTGPWIHSEMFSCNHILPQIPQKLLPPTATGCVFCSVL